MLNIKTKIIDRCQFKKLKFFFRYLKKTKMFNNYNLEANVTIY